MRRRTTRCGVGRTPHDRLHPRLYAAELAGTAALVAVGLSFVILLSAPGSQAIVLLPDAPLRRAVTGFLFGSTGALVTYSRWAGSAAHTSVVQGSDDWC